MRARAVDATSAGDPTYTSQPPRSSRANSQQVRTMLWGPRSTQGWPCSSVPITGQLDWSALRKRVGVRHHP